MSESPPCLDDEKEGGDVCDERETQDEEQADDEPTVTLSKRQMKKQLKAQRFRENRKEKRKQERDRQKQKRRLARESGNDVNAGPSRKKLREHTMASSSCLVRVAVDMSFDDLMSERDQRKTLSQLNFCYATNRRSLHPVQFYVTNFSGPSRTIFDTIETNKKWDVNLRKEDYLTIFDKSQVVYLTSESENVVETLEVDKVYVIGGLIDHNAHKGLCHRLALEKGIAHGRLPIDEYVEMKTRKVLAINHVFDILVRYTECGSWKDAFFSVIPKRKGVVEKPLDHPHSPHSPLDHPHSPHSPLDHPHSPHSPHNSPTDLHHPPPLSPTHQHFPLVHSPKLLPPSDPILS